MYNWTKLMVDWGQPGRKMGKFKINAKAVEGRERKQATAEAKKKKKEEEEEVKKSKEWEVGAKDNKKKIDEEEKRQEKLAKKKERELLQQLEESSIKSRVKPAKIQISPPPLSVSSVNSPKSINVSPYLNLEPLNRPGSALSSTTKLSDSNLSQYSASNLDDAISLLEATNSTADSLSLERHPERRVKAAFAIYEEKEMPILKLENPGLRLSQLREILKKNWKKAPENPFNQPTISYRATRDEESAFAAQHLTNELEKFKM